MTLGLTISVGISYNKFLAGLTHSAAKKGYNILLCDNINLTKKRLPLLQQQLSISGIIVLSAGNPYFEYSNSTEESIVEALCSISVPSLIINGENNYQDKGIDSLYFGFFGRSNIYLLTTCVAQDIFFCLSLFF